MFLPGFALALLTFNLPASMIGDRPCSHNLGHRGLLWKVWFLEGMPHLPNVAKSAGSTLLCYVNGKVLFDKDIRQRLLVLNKDEALTKDPVELSVLE
jgi:hypothetical protein